MENPYRCPSCETNRSRFNLIEQSPVAVRKDPVSGQILGRIDEDDPFQIRYHGESVRVQCGVCGLVEAEQRFIKTAQRGAGSGGTGP